MRVEEANLVHVARVQRVRQQIHGCVAFAQAGRYTSTPIAGLATPERPVETHQEAAEPDGLGAIATLRCQRAEQTCVARVARAPARQLRGDGAGGVHMPGRIVGQGAFEAQVFARAYRRGLALQPGEGASERHAGGGAVAGYSEVDSRLP